MRLRGATLAAGLVLFGIGGGARGQEGGAPEAAGHPPAGTVPAVEPAGSAAPPAGREPISAAFRSGAASAETVRGPGPLKAFFQLLLTAYREGISPVDGPSCPFHPSCSRFAREAIRLHGLVPGMVMTGDRLLRCNGSGRDRYPKRPDGSLHDPP